MLHQDFLSRLESSLKSEWERVLRDSALIRLIRSREFDRRLYAIYLTETFHYTRHNSRNQALVAARHEKIDPRYAKFCLEHAAEETGHEYMAFHDLKSLGFPVSDESLPEPLPETQALIGYLYYISTHGNPLQRLGYSFWAENVYGFIAEPLATLAQVCQLKPEQMTFFVQHATIDAKHADEVKSVLTKFVKTEADQRAVEEVMRMSLKLTQLMIDSAAEQYMAVATGKNTRYSFLPG
jgi:pyrroloquinoline quinone (PQQ) biosynthesis protein C